MSVEVFQTFAWYYLRYVVMINYKCSHFYIYFVMTFIRLVIPNVYTRPKIHKSNKTNNDVLLALYGYDSDCL